MKKKEDYEFETILEYMENIHTEKKHETIFKKEKEKGICIY